MKQLYFLLLFLPGSLALSLPAWPQASSADSVFLQQALAHVSQLYTKEIAENLHLYSGSEYLPPGHGVKGFPFFQSPGPQKGDIRYDGHLYTGIPLQYDIVEDNLVIGDYTGNVFIRLVKNNLQYFVVDGHRFVHIRAGKGLPAAGFYESLYSGRLNAWARRQKVITHAADNTASYTSYDSWLLEKDGVFVTVEGERPVLAVLSDKKEAVKKYIRSNKLAFKKDPVAFLTGTLGYYDQLNH